MQEKIPASLYIHLPWCIQKCPYCDFNSHAVKNDLPEALYVSALLHEWGSRLPLLQGRPLTSIFFGGGTPSLFTPSSIEQILAGIAKHTPLPAEITLEANPGTIDEGRFEGFRRAGVTRLSLGVQSLQDDKLKLLGRIHDSQQAIRAMTAAREAGFDNINIDLMYGLPQQTLPDALDDLANALALKPTHLSWYQLTLEPNTLFHKHPPSLPPDDLIWDMQLAGQASLQEAGFHQYEVSAYALSQKECVHNLNYWEFGDYLGIGAGAHSKITDNVSRKILRYAQVKHPADYLNAAKRKATHFTPVPTAELPFEFMLNALRLKKGVPALFFPERTYLTLKPVESILNEAKQQDLMVKGSDRLCATAFGFRFLNNLVERFLPST